MSDYPVLRSAIRRLIEGHDFGAGVVVLRKFADGYRILCLIGDHGSDIPKGGMEPDDDGALDAALRELREEAGITSIEFPWGTDSVVVGDLMAFVGLTEQDAVIRPNPETGEAEHDRAEWLPIATAQESFEGDLAHIVGWAVLRANTY